ncbi:hypothetical protein O1L60_44490 [Streptomyces diastatochromogenes]|nr:hypothetical protein [Streptomyces diastatochromogenes]
MRFKAYLGNAWFMQVTAWARASGQLFWTPPEDGFEFLAAARQYSAVVSVERALGVAPSMAPHTAAEAGQLTFCATATFVQADLTVRVVITRGASKILRIGEITVERSAHEPARFSSSSDALKWLRASAWVLPAPGRNEP